MPYVEVPDVSEYEGLKKNKEFKSMFDRAIKIKQQIADLEAELKGDGDEVGLLEKLESVLITEEVEGTVAYKGWQLRVIDKKGAPKLDRKILLDLLGPKGVEIMKKATVVGAPSHYVQLVSPKAKDEDE